MLYEEPCSTAPTEVSEMKAKPQSTAPTTLARKPPKHKGCRQLQSLQRDSDSKAGTSILRPTSVAHLPFV
ncbi:hypothetical protein M5D96_007650, partial [Drosophila gunungcola]